MRPCPRALQTAAAVPLGTCDGVADASVRHEELQINRSSSVYVWGLSVGNPGRLNGQEGLAADNVASCALAAPRRRGRRSALSATPTYFLSAGGNYERGGYRQTTAGRSWEAEADSSKKVDRVSRGQVARRSSVSKAGAVLGDWPTRDGRCSEGLHPCLRVRRWEATERPDVLARPYRESWTQMVSRRIDYRATHDPARRMPGA